MAEPNQHRDEESLQAPEKLVEALNDLQRERIFVPPTVDMAVLQRAREHLRRLERPQSSWKHWLSWAAMAACLALAVWLGERFSNPTRTRSFAREDINRDGRVDVLDAFALARQIEAGGILDPRWDINGDGRVDRADVNAIAARAVNLAQAGPAPKRSADRRGISNKTTLTLTLSRPTGVGTASPGPADFKSAIRQIENLRYETSDRRTVNRYSSRLVLTATRRHHASENREDRS